MFPECQGCIENNKWACIECEFELVDLYASQEYPYDEYED